MKNVFIIAVSVILSVVVTITFFSGSETQTIKAEKSVFDRVMHTGKIRCGYFPYAPALIVDPNTGAKSGIFYDIMEEIGERLNLQIEWSTEVGYGVIQEGFKTNKFDIFCNTIWPTPERSKTAIFSNALYYSSVITVVKEDDLRFDNDLSLLNNPDVKISVKEGDITESIARGLFPKAEFVAIPQLANTSQQLDDVFHSKSDATFNETSLVYRYLKESGNKLKIIGLDKPLKYFPNTIMMPEKEFQLKHMIDTTLQNLISEGFVDRTIEKYDQFGKSFLKVSDPYEPHTSLIKKEK